MTSPSFHNSSPISSISSVTSINVSPSKSKRSSDVSLSLRRFSNSPKPKVKRLGKPIDGFNSSYVGFRPSDFRSIQDLSHLRHYVEAHSSSEQAVSVLESLDTMLKSIPIAGYENFEPDEKSSTINKLIEAYNFAWNEGTLQLKQINEEHAEIFVKIKNFYMFLLNEYPLLLTDYQKQVAELKNQCKEKDHEISILKKEIISINKINDEAREFIAGLRDEIIRLKNRKIFFKQELNDMTLQNDKLQEELTELRCKMAREIEIKNDIMALGDSGYLKNSPSFELQKEAEKEFVDAGINTDPFNFESESLSNSFIQSNKNHKSQIFTISAEAIENTAKAEPHSALRHVIYSFMINEEKNIDLKGKIDNNAEMKKFYWMFPKIISIMISGIQFEDSSHPFNSFEDLLICFLTHHYQTNYLIQQIFSSLIMSAQLLDGVSPVIHLFNKFAKCEYDFFVFRFFHTVLEFSICYATPDISSLAANDAITPEDTIITISKEKARFVFHACFPFKDPPNALNDGLNSKEISYWSFIELLIEEFMSSRSHFWSVLKNALLLSDCSDNTNISFSQFASFMGIIFPGIKQNVIKTQWKALLIREAASNSSRTNVLEFSSLTFLCASKDETINNVMNIVTAKDFSHLYYDMSSPMLDILAFIVNRLTYYIPTISVQVPEIQSEFEFQSFKIRDALFKCNISSAVSHYRYLLHKLDYLTVRNLTLITINKSLQSKDAEELIEHMKLREKVTGISSSN